MSLFIFLTVLQAVIAAALVGLILIQRSEGGGLGIGGSPSGFMSARGTADFLTRATAILATIFVVLSIVLATLAVGFSTTKKIDTSLDRTIPVTTTDSPNATNTDAQPEADGQNAADPLAGSTQ